VVSDATSESARGQVAGPLTIADLQAALNPGRETQIAGAVFWNRNIGAFRQTVLLAIDETLEALHSPDVPAHWRSELEGQLEALREHLELADHAAAMVRIH
jgi:hypothetical protein